MIIVTGSIVARPDSVDELIALSIEHVRRSRTESGCKSHAVHRDIENPLRLVFFEEWEDRAALAAHFAVPASRAFVKAARPLAAEPPAMNIFDAAPTAIAP
jgi:quinol monooxygenase YgiN